MALLVRACGLMLVSALVVPAAVPAIAAPAPSLFPLVVGATWTRVNDDGTEATSRVVGSKTVGTRQCMVVERKAVERGRERVSRTCYLATPTEVIVLETTSMRGQQTVLNPPRTVLRLPPREGLSWSWSLADSVFELKITEKWIGEETIKVKAGTFRAWKLQTVTKGENSEIAALTWYAPGVGVVRNERKGHRGDREFSGWTELVSYKVP